jgi:hypothetical protein
VFYILELTGKVLADSMDNGSLLNAKQKYRQNSQKTFKKNDFTVKSRLKNRINI